MINKWLYNAGAFFLYLISLLPLSVLYLISYVAYLFLFYVIKYRRHVVLKNLINSFPDKELYELKQIEKKFYKYLADLFFEGIKMISASPQYIFKRYTFKNTELLKSLEQEKQSFVMAVGHYGNWEWSVITTPMVTSALPLIIYKPLNNRTFDGIFRKIREKSGAKMIAMRIALRKMLQYKNQQTCTVFAADQTPAMDGAYAWLNFLNQPTAVFTGIEKIAKSMNYPVVFCDINVNGRGRYHAEFIEITHTPRETEDLEITEKYIRLLEKTINQRPEYWLWSHKRWKIKPKDN